MRPQPVRAPRSAARSLALLIAALLAVITACAPADPAPPEPGAPSPESSRSDRPTAADEAEVRGLLDKINDAWAGGDATGYASYHTVDADLIDFRGVHAVGRQEIIELMQPAFDTVLKGTKVEARIVALRFLDPDVAIFHTEGEVVPTGAPSIQTFVVTRTPQGWAIAAFQNTRIEGGR